MRILCDLVTSYIALNGIIVLATICMVSLVVGKIANDSDIYRMEREKWGLDFRP